MHIVITKINFKNKQITVNSMKINKKTNSKLLVYSYSTLKYYDSKIIFFYGRKNI